jgi:hypothetical protein
LAAAQTPEAEKVASTNTAIIGYRITDDNGNYESDLHDVTMHFDGSGSGTWTLNYSAHLRVWNASNPSHPTIVVSGHAYAITVPATDIALKVGNT